MHHVAAVAAGIAHGELADGGEDVDSATRGDRSCAAPKFGEDREDHEDGQNQAHERVKLMPADRKPDYAGYETADHGPGKIPSQAVQRSFAPRQQRADARKE